MLRTGVYNDNGGNAGASLLAPGDVTNGEAFITVPNETGILRVGRGDLSKSAMVLDGDGYLQIAGSLTFVPFDNEATFEQVREARNDENALLWVDGPTRFGAKTTLSNHGSGDVYTPLFEVLGGPTHLREGLAVGFADGYDGEEEREALFRVKGDGGGWIEDGLRVGGVIAVGVSRRSDVKESLGLHVGPGGNARIEGDVFVSGIHGVGTDRPRERLHVAAASEEEKEGGEGQATALVDGMVYCMSGAGVGTSNVGEGVALRVADGLRTVLGGETEARLGLQVTSSDLTVVSGKHGIGTRSPLAAFHLANDDDDGERPEQDRNHALLEGHLLVTGRTGLGASLASSNDVARVQEALHVGPGHNAKFEGRAFFTGDGVVFGGSNDGGASESDFEGYAFDVRDTWDARFGRDVSVAGTLRVGEKRSTETNMYDDRLHLADGNLFVGGEAYVANRHGVGTRYPAEALHVARVPGSGPASANARVDGDMYVAGMHGVGTSNVLEALHVAGGGNARFDAHAYVSLGLSIGGGSASNAVSTDASLALAVEGGESRFGGGGVLVRDGGLAVGMPSFSDEALEGALHVGRGRRALFDSNVSVRERLGVRVLASDGSGAAGVPEEALHVGGGGNAKLDADLYVRSGVGVGTSNLREALHVAPGRNAMFEGATLSVVNGCHLAVGTSNPGARFHLSREDGLGSDALIEGGVTIDGGLASKSARVDTFPTDATETSFSSSRFGATQVSIQRRIVDSNEDAGYPEFHQAFVSAPEREAVGIGSNVWGVGALYPSNSNSSSSSSNLSNSVRVENTTSVFGHGISPRHVAESGAGIFIDSSTGYVGIGEHAPKYRLHVSRGIVRDNTGVIGPMLQLRTPAQYDDVAAGSSLVLDRDTEAGNPGSDTSRPMFSGGSNMVRDVDATTFPDGRRLGGDQWNRVRFVFRGALLTDNSASYADIRVERFDYDPIRRVGRYVAATSPFRLDTGSVGMATGYTTWTTPWVQAPTTHYVSYHYGLRVVRVFPERTQMTGTESETVPTRFRFGSVYAQFSSSS
jgi:hypothetical protein